MDIIYVKNNLNKPNLTQPIGAYFNPPQEMESLKKLYRIFITYADSQWQCKESVNRELLIKILGDWIVELADQYRDADRKGKRAVNIEELRKFAPEFGKALGFYRNYKIPATGLNKGGGYQHQWVIERPWYSSNDILIRADLEKEVTDFANKIAVEIEPDKTKEVTLDQIKNYLNSKP